MPCGPNTRSRTARSTQGCPPARPGARRAHRPGRDLPNQGAADAVPLPIGRNGQWREARDRMLRVRVVQRHVADHHVADDASAELGDDRQLGDEVRGSADASTRRASTGRSERRPDDLGDRISVPGRLGPADRHAVHARHEIDPQHHRSTEGRGTKEDRGMVCVARAASNVVIQRCAPRGSPRAHLIAAGRPSTRSARTASGSRGEQPPQQWRRHRERGVRDHSERAPGKTEIGRVGLDDDHRCVRESGAQSAARAMCNSTATTRAPAATSGAVIEPVPAPMSSTRSPARTPHQRRGDGRRRSQADAIPSPTAGRRRARRTITVNTPRYARHHGGRANSNSRPARHAWSSARPPLHFGRRPHPPRSAVRRAGITRPAGDPELVLQPLRSRLGIFDRLVGFTHSYSCLGGLAAVTLQLLAGVHELARGLCGRAGRRRCRPAGPSAARGTLRAS